MNFITSQSFREKSNYLNLCIGKNENFVCFHQNGSYIKEIFLITKFT